MESLAPPVVAVMVTCDPGPWFEETLRSFAAQDYPELSVLVLDAASVVDPTPRVAAVLPNAFVRRLPENRGFAASADSVLGMVAGASHLLLCHDDVALEPDVVHVLVEESFRSNAGVVGPKLVSWDDSRRLLHVGMAVDKSGAVVDRVEPGELDQGQHDAVQDVFLAPGGCLLVRADLFAELGGFDPAVVALGDDLDLCWRAQVAGARVVVAPGAKVRHLERLAAGARPLPRGAPSLQALQRRHELRIVLVAYSRAHLLRVLPQVVALSAGEMAVALLSGHRQRALALWHAWWWNWSRRKEVRAARAALAERRRLADSEVRRLQLHGSARLTRYLRRLFTQGVEVAHSVVPEALGSAGAPGSVASRRAPGPPPHTGPAGPGQVPPAAALAPAPRTRPVAAGWYGRVATLSVVALVLVMGSRQLLGGGLPFFGELLRLPSWGTLLHRFAGGWQSQGLGSSDPTSPATGALGVAALLLGGSSGLLQKVVVLGCVPLGAWGMSRLARPFGHVRSRVASSVAYVALPVAYDALAQGRWDALLAFAAAPWIVNRLAQASELEPFTAAARSPRQHRRRRLAHRMLGLGLVEAVLCSLAPAGAALTLLVALSLSIGAVLCLGAAGWRPAGRMLSLAVGSTAVTVVLLAPWSFALLAGPQRWAAVTGLGVLPGTGPGWASLLRLAVGPIGDSPLAFGLVLAAALPMLVAARHRLTWAAMAWAMIASGLVLAWCEGRGWTAPFAVDPQMLLVPAAVGVALCVGLGVAAFIDDLPGRRFGWRQAMAAAAAAMAVLGTLPVLAAAGSGRWDLPLTGYGEATAWMAAKAPPGGFRVLWLGDPRALPGGAWSLDSGVGFAVSDGSLPDATAMWAGSDPGKRAGELADELRLAERHGTVQLGEQLAALHIRYVVVAEGLAPEIPGYQTPAFYPAPARLTDALAAQTDLSQVPGQGGLQVYENTAASGPPPPHAGSPVAYRAGLAAEGALWLAVVVAMLRRLGRSARRRRRHLAPGESASPQGGTAPPPLRPAGELRPPAGVGRS